MKKIVLLFVFFLQIYIISSTLPVAAGPVSTNYELKDYGFGAGGTENSTSTNYKILGVAGEVESSRSGSTNFQAGGGLVYTMMSNVPPAPALTNPGSFYNKLKLVINNGGNPSNAKFAIAISTDNFASDMRYVQNDNTIGTSLGLEDWQTYVGWGGASGINIIGLSSDTTYTVKVASKRGNFSESGFGPTAQVATVGPQLSFDIDVAPTDTKTDPPFSVSIGELTPATVVTAVNKVWVDLSTNGTGGGAVYVYGNNNGLASSTASYTINSVNGNLGSLSEGYGVRGSYTSGGPMELVAPYNGGGDIVGILDTNKRMIFDSSGLDVTGGRAAFEIKAKASNVAPAESDYNDTITVIASATF